MTLNLLKPATGQAKKPSEIRDNFQGLLGLALPDCILPNSDGTFGGKMTVGSDLSVGISGFRAIIGGKYHEIADFNLAATARRAQLLYATKNTATDNVTPTTGVLTAAFPAADDGTVCRWIIDSSPTITSTVGSNTLTKSGTTTQVNGWANDYAGQGDGSTGCYTSVNATGLPSAAYYAQESFLIVTTFKLTASGRRCPIVLNGGGSLGIEFGTYRNTGLALYYHTGGGNSTLDTGFDCEDGKTYAIEVQVVSAGLVVSVNGQKIYKYTGAVYAGGHTSVTLFGGNNFYYSGTIHYVELRNALRTPAQIAAISNALLLPCRYEPEYQIIGGTNIGTLTGGGGLSSAFNGATSEAYSAAANIVSTGAITGTVGKNWGTAKKVKRFIAYGSDVNFSSAGGYIRLKFWASGVTLWDSGVTTSAIGASIDVNSFSGLDISTAYQYHWFEITEILGNGGSHVIAVSELMMFTEASISNLPPLMNS